MTEGITETNIPSIQLMVGMGIPLYRIACLRATYNKDPKVGKTQALLLMPVYPRRCFHYLIRCCP